MRSTRLISIMVATSLAAAAGVATMTWIGASAAHEVVRLHLGTDAVRFSLGTVTQPITVGKNSCAINSLEPLIDLSSGGNQSAPGYADLGLGVKGSPSSGNGSPCAQIDPTEVLTLRPGTTLGNRTFKSLRLDLEMRDNAIVVVTVSRTVGTVTASEVYRLQTGTNIQPAQASELDYDISAPYFAASTPGDNVDACASPNSSGPNNAGNDNCQWTIAPGFNFDTVRLTTEIGTVTLEGSGDFANDPNFDSLFYLSNAAPSAVNDVVTTNEDTAVTFNVLTNDSDADGDTLTVSGNTQPTNGTGVTTVSPSGSSTYTPNANYNGTDSFTYTVTDGTDSSTATVTITVTPVNDAPVANPDSAEVNQNASVVTSVVISVLANDTDVDLDSLTVGIGTLSTPGHGTAVIEGTSIRYTPVPGFSGTDSFTYKASDGTANSNAATVTVDVCTVGPVSDRDGVVNATFVLLTGAEACKQYAVDAVEVDPATGSGSVLFTPQGGVKVDYRGYLSFEPQAASAEGPLSLLLEYDPLGGIAFTPVRWCINPLFDEAGDVTTATLPAGETWCIAGETSRGDINGEAVTVWQVFGNDDPKFQ